MIFDARDPSMLSFRSVFERKTTAAVLRSAPIGSHIFNIQFHTSTRKGNIRSLFTCVIEVYLLSVERQVIKEEGSWEKQAFRKIKNK